MQLKDEKALCSTESPIRTATMTVRPRRGFTGTFGLA